jgi:pilus assembly protein CpaB
VATAAVVVFAAALSSEGGGDSTYVVAARDLPAGTIIGAGDTTTARLGLDATTRSRAFEGAADLIGRALAVAVEPGDLIESAMLAAPDGISLRPVSIPVDGNSLVGLASGASVDVLAADSPAAGGPATVTVILRGADLLSVAADRSGLLSGSGTTAAEVVTLGVADLAEAEQLMGAAHSGTVELVQAEPADGTGPGPGAG